MPVRSLTQSVLRWPRPEQVLADARVWADEQRRLRPSLRRVGVFGSYGRGTASVGSDLDLPLSCDALVLTPAELEQLLRGSSRMARELQADLLWLN